MSADAAIAAVRSRARASRPRAEERWAAAVGVPELDDCARRFRDAGRLTLNFHPDRIARSGVDVADGLLLSGSYQSQWVTGLSAGSRSAIAGGERQRFERELFDDSYRRADPATTEFPVYGSFDLVFDPHGGSPRFGSSFLILHRYVCDRTTMCIGDSHMTPRDVGTIDEPWSILAGLAEQAVNGELLNRNLGIDVLLKSLGGAYRSTGPSRDLDGYIEIQVHDGVSLEADVAQVVLDPSFRNTSIEESLRRAADRYGFPVAWHAGSELHVDEVPTDFRGPTMPTLARTVARPDGIVDAHAIGLRSKTVTFTKALPTGDSHYSELQQLKYLWHTLLAHGHDAATS